MISVPLLLPLLVTHTSVPLGEGLVLVSRIGEKTVFNFNDSLKEGRERSEGLLPAQLSNPLSKPGLTHCCLTLLRVTLPLGL